MTPHEKEVITAYREKAGVQNAVDILLGIENKWILHKVKAYALNAGGDI